MSEKVVDRAKRSKKTFDDKLNELVEEYKDFAKDKSKLKVGDIAGVIYSQIFYPLIEEIDGFYYLGGDNIRMVLKTKCKIYQSNNSVLQVFPSQDDITFGKSPIIPIGCDPTSLKAFPKGLDKFQKKLLP